jgi:uncharacterized protein (DUF427 family)
MTMRAVWNGTVLAESDQTVVVEGRHYFPPDSVHWEHFAESDKSTTCPWKGRAGYYTVVADGKVNRDAAWYYPSPYAAAARIGGHVAFWHGVRVERSGSPPSGRGERLGFLRRLFGAEAGAARS